MTDLDALRKAVGTAADRATARMVLADELDARGEHVEAALQRVLAEPASDFHRLNYAAAVEADNPARAEFVRVQVELASMPIAAPEAPPRKSPRGPYGKSWIRHRADVRAWRRGGQQVADRMRALQSRERALLADHLRDTLRSELPASAPRWAFYLSRQGREYDDGWTFGLSRGFADRLTITAADWLLWGDAILAAHPLDRVRLTTLPEVELAGGRATPDDWISWRLKGRRAVHSVTCPQATGTDRDLVVALLPAEWPGVTFEVPAVTYLTATGLSSLSDPREVLRRRAGSPEKIQQRIRAIQERLAAFASGNPPPG